MDESDLPVVVKVGGSLYDLPRLGVHLRAWLDQLETRRVLLVPGGGATVEAIRSLDRLHSLGQKCAHGLALQAMGLNAHVLMHLVPNTNFTHDREGLEYCWQV